MIIGASYFFQELNLERVLMLEINGELNEILLKMNFLITDINYIIIYT